MSRSPVNSSSHLNFPIRIAAPVSTRSCFFDWQCFIKTDWTHVRGRFGTGKPFGDKSSSEICFDSVFKRLSSSILWLRRGFQSVLVTLFPLQQIFRVATSTSTQDCRGSLLVGFFVDGVK